MKEQRYNIVMYVPLGKRYGVMTVRTEEERICGEIEILQHTDAFEGRRQRDGSVEIRGKITTFVQMNHYIGNGSISSERVHFFLYAGENVFEIEGISV